MRVEKSLRDNKHQANQFYSNNFKKQLNQEHRKQYQGDYSMQILRQQECV